jgi:hypothetical protein
MKNLATAVVVLFSSLSALASVGVDNQKDSLEGLTKSYSEKYKCPITWTLNEKNLKLPSESSRGPVARMVGEVEYEVRLACQRGGFEKINKVVISCGTATADNDKCSDDQRKDGASVKLSGKTLNVSGKYLNCHCSSDAANSGIKAIVAE